MLLPEKKNMTTTDITETVQNINSAITEKQATAENAIASLNEQITTAQNKLKTLEAQANNLTGKAQSYAQASLSRSKTAVQRTIDQANARIAEIQSKMEEWVSNKTSTFANWLVEKTTDLTTQKAAQETKQLASEASVLTAE